MTEPVSARAPLIILIPSKDDHGALRLCIEALAAALAADDRQGHLVVIDDASRVPLRAGSIPLTASGSILELTIVRLRRSLGHQRAIAIGLAYVYDQVRASTVVVMDGDGEDRPEDVPRLLAALERSQEPSLVFGERTRRSESLTFRLGYQAYRLLHRLLTGIPVKFGNFSAVPTEFLSPLVVSSELWNHYVAAVLKLGLPYRPFPTPRGPRLAGQSRMNVVGLVVHGLSAISVFGDLVGVRLLVAGGAIGFVLIAALMAVVVATVLMNVHVPDWVVAAVGVSLVLLLQLGMAMLAFIFVVLGSRASTNVIPLRDYRWFVEGEHTLVTPAGKGADA
jgi:polyisoprenyl-phosphate glycosyltransferase